MATIRSHRDLIVYQRSMDLVESTYRLLPMLPATERYGLSSQLARAVISVPANIAEGHARSGSKSYSHFLAVSRGSLMEVETYLLLVQRLGFVDEQNLAPLFDLIGQISRMIVAIRQKLRQNAARGNDGPSPESSLEP